MLTHPTLDLLHKLGLHGMAKGFKELERQPEVTGLAHRGMAGLAPGTRGHTAAAKTLRDPRSCRQATAIRQY